MSIEIFRTTIQNSQAANAVTQCLQDHFPATRITIDLEDCDRVLRMEGPNLICEKIIEILSTAGYACEILV